MHQSVDDRLDAIVATRDPYAVQATISALETLLEEHPRHARSLYELGNTHGMLRDGERARHFYDEALSAGLHGEALRRCLLRYGAVLHELGESEAAQSLLEEARSRFAGPPARAVFDAVELHMQGRTDEAFDALLEIVTESFGVSEEDRYRAAYFRALLPPR
ncbi:tetratricopeptide repeat protein [Demequina zhanjiangensis]|uniref:Tetratricopeptide repeat protein n=1 Tax=Demequina zhanjiangensis TaxID=3051659 RepID=A0ABT8FX00_9MICO|nr:tetratricopeptide repeat protein [Demequina sp. SYSU T00b26]MDN4471421.1 tetratricopeptide repeat protein [Demequina sp. SYSU T00b26]